MSSKVFSHTKTFSTFGKPVYIKTGPSNHEIRTAYRRPIGYSSELKDILLSNYSRMEYPYRNHLHLLRDLTEEVLGEIKRFLVCLDAYLESSNPLQSAKEILVLSALGNEGSSIQKRIKRASIYKTFNTAPYESDEDLENVPSYSFKEIGDIFNYSYLPLWEEEVNDYQEGFTPISQTNRMLDLFRSKLKEILPEEIDIIDKEEILLENSSSSCLLTKPKTPVGVKGPRKGTSNPVPKITGKKFKEKQFHNTMGNSIGKALRTVVPAGVQSYRDTVMLTVPASNRVTWIDRQTMNVLSRVDRHIHLQTNQLIRKRINRLGKKFSYFVQRDIKKEGITKPRTLLKIMLEELHNMYPYAEAYEETCFYDDFTLILEDRSEVVPNRGHGLGMANTLTTLMNIVIFELAITLEDDDLEVISGKADSLSLNDDFVAAFESEDDSYAYQDREQRVMSELDILYAPKKSFPSYNSFVIAEEYYPRTFSKKESYYRSEVLSALSCMNIIHAKSLVNSFINLDTIEYWEIYKGEIIAFWGYEFFPEEYKYPFRCGGWVTYTANQVCLDLGVLDSLDYKRKVYAAFKASRLTTPRVYVREKESSYLTPYIKVLGNIKVIDEVKPYVDIGTMEEISSKYFVFRNNPQKAEQAFKGLLKRRSEEFKRWNSSHAPDFRSFIDEYICEEIDYYPLEYMIQSYIRVDHVKYKRYRDIWTSPTPIKTALSVENPHLSNLKGEYYSLMCSKNLPLFTPDSNSWIKLNEEKLIYTFSISVDWNIERVVPKTRSKEDEVLLQSSYINPIAFTQLCNAMGQVQIPILYEKYRSRFIKEKLKPFNGVSIPLHIVPRLINTTRELLEEITSEVSDVDDFTSLIEDILEEYRQKVKKKEGKEEKPPPQHSHEEESVEPERLTEIPLLESLEQVDDLLRDFRLSKVHIHWANARYAGEKMSDQSRQVWGTTVQRQSAQRKSEEEYLSIASRSAGLNPAEEALFRRIRELEEIEAREASEEEEDIAQAMFSLFEEG